MTEFVEEKKKERSDEQQRAARVSKKRFVGLAIAAVLCAATWLAPIPRPGPAPQPLTAKFTLASGRMTLVLAAKRIESFRTARRRLPTTLADAGVTEAMEYTQTTDGQFVLRLVVGAATLTFDSSVSRAAFTEDAKAIVAATGK
ncbi:MAG: hypothetical protein ACT4P7_23265 [Gemmatimonadaceae bacterium]